MALLRIDRSLFPEEAVTVASITWLQLQQVDNLLLSAEDFAGYDTPRHMVNRAVGGDRVAKERCVFVLNRHLEPSED